jgi:exopolysaccharide production protein ExoZ
MLFNVQALRALAAWLVVAVHLEALLARAGVPMGTTAFGNAGVDLFFVISGFIMVYTTRDRPIGALGFWRNRALRIVPLYWAVTFAVFALALVAPALLQSTRADPMHLLKSLFFVPYARDDGATMPVVFVGWTLNLEMMFYALFGLGLLLRRRSHAYMATAAALFCLFMAGRFFSSDAAWFRLYTTPMVLEFGFGMALALLWRRLPERAPTAAAALAALSLVGGLAALVAVPLLYPGTERAIAAGVPAIFVVGGALALERWGAVLGAPAVKLFGDASYAIYLTHFFVTQAFVKAAAVLKLDHPWLVALLVFVAYAAVTLAGVGVHLLVEKPLGRLAKALLAERRARAAAPLAHS